MSTNYEFKYTGAADKEYYQMTLEFSDSSVMIINKEPVNKINSNTLFLSGNSVAMKSILGSSKAKLVALRSESIEHRIFLSDEVNDLVKITLSNASNELVIPSEETQDQFENWIRDSAGYFKNIAIESISGNIAGVNAHEFRVNTENLDSYTQFSYIQKDDYPHYDQISYSNRVVDLDGFVSNSMKVSRAKVELGGEISNTLVRPDFSKQFLGFEIVKSKDSFLTGVEDIKITPEVGSKYTSPSPLIDSKSYLSGESFISTMTSKVPGIELDNSGVLSVDIDKLPQMTTNEFTIHASNSDGFSDSVKVTFNVSEESPTIHETNYMNPVSTSLSRLYRPEVTWKYPKFSNLQESNDKYITKVEDDSWLVMKNWNEVLSIDGNTIRSLFRVRRWKDNFSGVIIDKTEFSATYDTLVKGGMITAMTIHGPVTIEIPKETNQ